MTPITVIFTIPEDSLGPVEARLRKKAKLTVDAFDRTAQTKIASGKLLTLDNQIDTTTGTVKGRAVFDNKNDALFPNQFVNTRLLVNTLAGGDAGSGIGDSTEWPSVVRVCDSKQFRAYAQRKAGSYQTAGNAG